MAVYRELFRSGELAERVRKAHSLLENCQLCGYACQVDRLAGILGKCGTGRQTVVSSYGPHFGEEAPLVGRWGAGTIFFTNCNLKCVYCQNYSISQLGEGTSVSSKALAQMMLDLQRRGCHNINLVSPTHQVPQILEALELSVAGGLSLPLVYNTGGYDSPEVLAILDGIVDIYMPDMKYSDEATARRLSGVKDYPQVNQNAVKEMHQQVGDLVLDDQGVAVRGLLVRHLVLPRGLARTKGVVSFLAKEVSRNTFLNIMAQYHPQHRAFEFPELDRPLLGEKFAQAVKMAINCGLARLDGLHSASALEILPVPDEAWNYGGRPLMQEKAGFHAIAQGRVQGVYFRDFTLRKARALGLTGYVRNLPDGRSVEVRAEGERAKLEQLLEHIKIGPEAARVDRVNVKWSDYSGNFKAFEMRF